MPAHAGGSLCITNAHVLTMDPHRPTARAVVIHDGIIEYVGSDEGARTEDRGIDRRIDAKGRTLIPGLNDAHGHFVHEGMMEVLCDLEGCRSLDEAYARIREYAEANPERDVIVAERWDESDWTPRRFPDRQGLDAAAGGRPVIARRIDGHTAVASSALLDIYDARWDGPTEGIHHDTGLLLEEPSLQFGNVVPYPMEDKIAGLHGVFARCARLGVTSVQGYERPDAWRAWQRAVRHLDLQGETPGVRAYVSCYSEFLDAHEAGGHETGTGSTWARFGGMKIFADGALGGWTAHLREPYSDKPETRGRRMFSDETLHDLVSRAHAARIQVHIHVIGDAAIDQGIDVYRRVHDADPEAFRAARHRFEHYEMGDAASHEAARSMGIVLSMQPNFVGAWSAKEGMYDDRLGSRHDGNNPFRTLLDMDAHVAFGSDCMPFGPLIGIRGTMSAPYPHQRLTFPEAIHAFTHGAAFAEHQEHVKGRIRPGLMGDVTLFTKDLSAADPGDGAILDGLDIALTVCDGRIRHDLDDAAHRRDHTTTSMAGEPVADSV